MTFFCRQPYEIDGIRWKPFDEEGQGQQVAVQWESKPVKSTHRVDANGWQTLSFAKKKGKQIEVVFLSKQKGKERGLRIAEIELLRDGQPIDLHLPQAFLYGQGSGGECGCMMQGFVIDRQGNTIAKTEVGYSKFYDDLWSKTGQYMYIVSSGKVLSVWVVDTITKEIVIRRRFPNAGELDVSWSGEKALKVYYGKDKQQILQVP